jgi:hypothetical protein
MGCNSSHETRLQSFVSNKKQWMLLHYLIMSNSHLLRALPCHWLCILRVVTALGQTAQQLAGLRRKLGRSHLEKLVVYPLPRHRIPLFVFQDNFFHKGQQGSPSRCASWRLASLGLLLDERLESRDACCCSKHG